MSIYYKKPEDKDTWQVSWKERANKCDIWMSSEQWLHPIIIEKDLSNVPPLIVENIIKWQKEVKIKKKGFYREWYIKYASIKFIYQDEFYQLFPGVVGATNELFESVSRQIERDLKDIESTLTIYTGMLD